MTYHPRTQRSSTLTRLESAAGTEAPSTRGWPSPPGPTVPGACGGPTSPAGSGHVQEDHTPTGDAWTAFPCDQARSRAYRWGEDGHRGGSHLG
ncbi:hypothetical protein BJ968_004758 [Kineococcus aurantiacus]|uniref:Uncharacterized protein n=1 Tax=Kineococcus aurantiacus TaxID=37633 RepID=A0A7Y9J3E2_9ACTN|nr:hypothetical protein [Kineococcus aurantiacus]